MLVGGSRRSGFAGSSVRAPAGDPSGVGMVGVAPPGGPDDEQREAAIRTIASMVAMPATMCFQRYCDALASGDAPVADAPAAGKPCPEAPGVGAPVAAAPA